MSQLNLKQLLSGDNLSSVVDKLNYNFDQIILTGGGPQGLRGNLGTPGLPGAQGLRGFIGPTGEKGTYLYAEAGIGPTAHFANGGLPSPRPGDVYMDAYPTSLEIYELDSTTNTWKIVQIMTLPGGYWKSVVDNGTISSQSPATTYMSNDIMVAEKLLITGASAAEAYLVAPLTANPGELKPEIANEYISTVMVGSTKNQLRLLSEDLTGATFSSNNDNWSRQNDIFYNQGGIIHSLEKAQVGSTIVQLYQICNGDTYGDKYFSLNLNGGKVGFTGPDNLIINSSILYGDTNNRAGSGIDHYVPLKAQFNIQDSLIVGDSSYYNYDFNNNQVLYKNRGIISQGNLSVGARDNSFYTGSFFGIDGDNGRVAIDTDSSIALSSRETSLSIGTDIFRGKGSVWNFTVNGYSHFSNTRFGSLTLRGQLCTTPNTPGVTASISYNTMYFGLTNSGFTRPLIGVANTDPKSLFEVGTGDRRISIGEMGSGMGAFNSYDARTYIGFNLHRNPVRDSWSRSLYNSSSKAIWAGNENTGLHFSFIPSTLLNSPVTLDDRTVTSLTRASIMASGAFWNHPTEAALEGAAGEELGLYIGFGASGASGDMPSFSAPSGRQFFRRPVAYFGQWDTPGSPVIFHTAGLTQTLFSAGDGVRSILPHYSFYGAADSGLYLAQGNAANSGTWGIEAYNIGLSISGISGVHVGGNSRDGARVGISTRVPHERFQIGDYLTVHDGGNKYFGYNVYYDESLESDRRIFGQPNGDDNETKEGYAKIQYIDYKYSGSLGVSRFSNTGTKIVFEVGNPGDTDELISPTSTSTNGRVYRGVMISPPLQANRTTHFNNATHVPQVGIGVKLDTDENNTNSGIDSIGTGKRGTLAIAAQMRQKPYTSGIGGMTTEDYYNIGLYSYDGYPVAGIQAAGGNPNTYTTRSLSLNLIGNNGNALYEDLPILYAESEINLTAKHQRKVQFGNSFRVGINSTVESISSPSALSVASLFGGLGHDVASLVVAGATAYYGSSDMAYHPASIHKGSIVIDQTPIWNNTTTSAAEGIWIKDGSIFGASKGINAYNFNWNQGGSIRGDRSTAAPVNTYAGDWNIRYRKVSITVLNENVIQTGLSFGKPVSGSQLTTNLFYIDDTGSVGVGTTNFSFTTSQYGPAKVGNEIIGETVTVTATSQPLTWPDLRGYSYAAINPDAVQGSFQSPVNANGGRTWNAKFAVGGITKQIGYINVSDTRLKTEIARPKIGASLEKIIKLSPVLFQWKEEYNPELNGKIELGFFAQEVKEIIPEAVSFAGSKNFDDEHVLEYNAIFVTAIGAIKDQQEIIEKQAETIKNLESKLSKIEELLERNNIS